MRALLVSTYDLGRQPFGLASPAAWLRRAGVDVECVDTSRGALDEARIAAATLVGFYLPMHTATRLAAPLIDQVRRINPAARLCAYGLYAPLNADWLRERGVDVVFGPEAEEALVAFVTAQGPKPKAQGPIPRLHFIQPDRSTLPPLEQYASLRLPDGSRRVVGSTDATRGCKHLCRHCPIVPVYRGAFRAVPLDVVLADIGAQAAAGARHISFGDPDFFNGPAHARRLVERLAMLFPGLTYDVTIKIEHLLQHADMLPLLRETGCLFVTSAVESIDDEVLARLRKGHTRADFVRAVATCRAAGVPLSPTFIPFTPWTTLEGYVELLDELAALDLAGAVAPIQLAIRLLVTADSALLELPELPELRERLEPFDGAALVWPWRHADARVDGVQQEVMRLVESMPQAARADVFDAVHALARDRAGRAGHSPSPRVPGRRAPTPPHLTEAWYCCAEVPSSISNLGI